MGRYFAAYAWILLLLASCDQSPSGDRITGLLRSDNGFLVDPGRCKISLLYQGFQVKAPVKGSTERKERYFEFAGAAGRALTIDVRGSIDSTVARTGKIAVSIGSRMKFQSIMSTQEPFVLRFDGVAATDGKVTPVRIGADFDKPDVEGEESLITVDSVDVALADTQRCS